MTFFTKKMISTKTKTKIYNQKLLTMIEAFKTWCHYLKSFKYKVFILINYNNFYLFIYIKSFVRII